MTGDTTATGRLNFIAGHPVADPPGDANSDNVYEITIVAWNGDTSHPNTGHRFFPVTVKVVDGNTPPTFTTDFKPLATCEPYTVTGTTSTRSPWWLRTARAPPPAPS